MARHTTPPLKGPATEALGGDLARLAALLKTHTPHDGSFSLRLPSVHVIRTSRVHKELVHGVLSPSLCVVAQGAKRVMLGQDAFSYDASRLLVYSVDVPVTAQVTRASLAEPFLCLRLDLDAGRIADLTARVFPYGLPRGQESRAVCVDQADPHIIDAASRLLELMAQPGDAELLAPLVIDEILIRLLRGPLGPRVALIGQDESRIQRVSKAVAWVRTHFDQPLDVERLALLVHMSPSSFHQHFKAVTSLSPLQYLCREAKPVAFENHSLSFRPPNGPLGGLFHAQTRLQRWKGGTKVCRCVQNGSIVCRRVQTVPNGLMKKN